MILHQIFWFNLVPMVFAVPVECGEHDGEDGGGVVADQAHDVPGGGMRLFPDASQGQLILLLRILIVQIGNQLTHCSSNRVLSLRLGNGDC